MCKKFTSILKYITQTTISIYNAYKFPQYWNYLLYMFSNTFSTVTILFFFRKLHRFNHIKKHRHRLGHAHQ